MTVGRLFHIKSSADSAAAATEATRSTSRSATGFSCDLAWRCAVEADRAPAEMERGGLRRTAPASVTAETPAGLPV